jgi:hypothetical protein
MKLQLGELCGECDSSSGAIAQDSLFHFVRKVLDVGISLGRASLPEHLRPGGRAAPSGVPPSVGSQIGNASLETNVPRNVGFPGP